MLLGRASSGPGRSPCRASAFRRVRQLHLPAPDARSETALPWIVDDPAAPPDPAVVRLTDFEGEWRFEAAGADTRASVVWETNPGGMLPDTDTVRKQWGKVAILDIASASHAAIRIQ